MLQSLRVYVLAFLQPHDYEKVFYDVGFSFLPLYYLFMVQNFVYKVLGVMFTITLRERFYSHFTLVIE